MAAHDFQVLLDRIHSYIRREVSAGFASADSIIETALDIYSYEANPILLRPHVQQYVREVIAAQLAEQAMWSTVTDCDRLDAAFAALEADGIVCRQHFSCCGSCGSSEIWDEIAAAQEHGRSVRGYTFYHMQDTELAVECNEICLSYGSVEEGEAAALAIGHAIVAAVQQQGLQTSWDGNRSKRILIELNWKRRRVM